MDKRITFSVFEKHAADTPAALAVQDENGAFTYGELNELTNRIARSLGSLTELKGAVVGVLIPNSRMYVATILAIQKSGGVFLPLGLDTPPLRMRAILEKATPQIIISTEETCQPLEEFLTAAEYSPEYCVSVGTEGVSSVTNSQGETLPLPAVDDTGNLDYLPDPDDDMYIIFTSGSTGVPKAVLGRHKGLAHFCHWEKNEFGFGENLRCSNLSPTTFDVSLRDIFVPLSCGGAVLVPDNDTRTTPAKLMNWLGENRISLTHIVPSVFRLVLDELERCDTRDALYENMQQVLLAGEALFSRDVTRWQGLFKQPAELVNLYGPSETTLAKIFNRRLQPTENPTEVMPLGQPISNTAILILKNKRLAEIGELGEIYIKTPFRSKGYFRDPERTAEAFLVNPLGDDPADLIYKTGDMGKYLEDHRIAFAGRMDRQVKINGVRIELSEVDAAVSKYPDIGTVLTMPERREDGEVFLICYFTTTAEVDIQRLRENLTDSLYSAMVPSFFVPLESFPLNINGKIDRRALPKPDALLYESSDFVPPQGEVEEALAEIWQGILGIKVVGVTTSFQELGGNSMHAIRCIGRISQELKKEISIRKFFAEPTIRAIGVQLAETSGEDAATIPHLPDRPDHAVAHTQKRLWLLQQMLPDFTAYNIPGFFRITGKLDLKKLEMAFQKLVSRHESLRTAFVENNGELRQKILESLTVSLEIFDLREEKNSEAATTRIAQTYCETVFDLSAPPLFRVGIAVLSEDEYVLFFTIHHIISDAWSMQLIMTETMAFYRAGAAADSAPELAPLAIQYRDYASWQNDQIAAGLWNTQKKYWLEQLAGELPRLDLPLDFPRPAVQSYAGATVVLNFPPTLSQALTKFAAATGDTPYTVLLALVNVLLHRYTGQEDILLNTPVTLRDQTSLHGIVGDFTNTLILRSQIDGAESFATQLKNTAQCVAAGRANADFPFDLLVEELEVRRDPSRAPLTDVGITLVETASLSGEESDLRLEPLEVEVAVSKYDLIFHFTQDGGDFALALEYNTALFRRERIERMLANFCNLADKSFSTPEAPLGLLDYLSQDEQESLGRFRRPWVENFSASTIPAAFAATVQKNPDALAILGDDGQSSYAELDAESTHLAQWLRTECALTEGSRVGVLLKRDHRFAPVFLGILKAGCVYVPFDEEHPAERIRYQAEEAGLAMLISEPTLREKCPAEITSRDFAEAAAFAEADTSTALPEINITPESPAYLIFTSGSTGKPKGVLLPHCGVVNRARDFNLRLFGETTWRLTQFASLSFDASINELLMMLLTGGCSVPVTKEVILDIEAYQALLLRQQVNFILLPPSYLRLLNQAELPTVKLIKTAGEAANPTDALHYSQTKTYINGYGPTEDSVCSCWHQVEPDGDYPLGIPLGKPVVDTEILVLDASLRQVPIGVDGELCVSDSGLAIEYIKQPELTAAAFVPHLSDPQRRMYRTGDKVRWQADGTLLFVGRFDEQVKINGYRIEPGEIENILTRYAGVENGCVVVREDDSGRRGLVGYFVPNAAGCDEVELRHYLATLLPHYMVPTSLVQLAELPINRSGKIDRGALPDPDEVSTSPSDHHVAACNDAERALLAVLQEVMKAETFGVHNNFFSLGIDSIRTIQCVSALRARGWEINAGAFFQYPTVAELAPIMQKGVGEIDQAAVTGEIARTPILDWFFKANFPQPEHFNQAVLLKLKQNIDGATIEKTLTALLAHHDMLRLTCTGTDLHLDDGKLPVPFVEVDLTDASDPNAAVATQVAEAHRSFTFDGSLLFRAVLYRAKDFDRLLLVFHHLIIDGVSWRIVMEDFESALREIIENRPATLPLKTHSYQTWAKTVSDYAASDTLKEEKKYWESVATTAQTTDRLKTEGERNGDTRLVETKIPLVQVEGVLANQSAEQSTLAMLLAAFLTALHKWQGIQKTTLLMEGHGREPLDPAIDVSRTVGWFTSSWPLVVNLPSENEVEKTARQIEAEFAKVPLHGVGYGMLRQSGEEGLAEIHPEISFNYLGQMNGAEDSDLFELLSTGDENAVAKENHTGEKLSAVLLVTGSELEIGLSFDAGELSATAVEELLNIYVAELTGLSEKMACLEQTVDYAGFSGGGLDDFLSGL